MTMSDDLRIDSHKLMLHPARVARWLESRGNWDLAKKIYPIYVEISPVGFCNHRCTFCALDFMEYQNRRLDPVILGERLKEMAALGIKSVMFAGEGEPTLYKELPEMIEICSVAGIDTALTTNMVPFTDTNSEIFVKNCSWIKVSINGGTAKNYAEIHRCQERDFGRVIENMERCVEIRRKNGYGCALGAQILLVDDNSHTVCELARTVRDAGMDYLVIKPYSQHLSSHTTRYKNIDYTKYLSLDEELKKYETDKFKVIFRANTIRKLSDGVRRYNKCGAVPFFWAYIMSDGSLYGCSAFLGDDRFNYGNIHGSGFGDIWEGEKRRRGYEIVRKELCIDDCRFNCRMDEVNRYLWELENPSKHVNFI